MNQGGCFRREKPVGSKGKELVMASGKEKLLALASGKEKLLVSGKELVLASGKERLLASHLGRQQGLCRPRNRWSEPGTQSRLPYRARQEQERSQESNGAGKILALDWA